MVTIQQLLRHKEEMNIVESERNKDHLLDEDVLTLYQSLYDTGLVESYRKRARLAKVSFSTMPVDQVQEQFQRAAKLIDVRILGNLNIPLRTLKRKSVSEEHRKEWIEEQRKIFNDQRVALESLLVPLAMLEACTAEVQKRIERVPLLIERLSFIDRRTTTDSEHQTIMDAITRLQKHQEEMKKSNVDEREQVHILEPEYLAKIEMFALVGGDAVSTEVPVEKVSFFAPENTKRNLGIAAPIAAASGYIFYQYHKKQVWYLKQLKARIMFIKMEKEERSKLLEDYNSFTVQWIPKYVRSLWGGDAFDEEIKERYVRERQEKLQAFKKSRQ